ncbi:MAG: glycoside hydrolase family 3 N-terminal domain-containing protein [Eubacteriales bacterium]|nr:glycoside hydrolase family 3 N-terminal domain-containing protein [Eubacteriales bacterium]
MEKYKNAELTPQERAKDLLARMTVEEKMGQVRTVMPFGLEPGVGAEQCPHGIGEVSTLLYKMLPDAEAQGAVLNTLQEKIMEQSGHGIPAIFHTEGLCGIFVQDAVSYPGGINRGASFDPELEEKIGAAVARAALATGMNHVFAPVLDVARDPRMGRQGEAYGEDPALISAMGAAYVKGIQQTEVAGKKAHAVAKHFAGSHMGMAGVHGADASITERQMREIYAKPFQAAITEAHMKGIMPAYNSINGRAISLDRKMLTKLLREEMGFDGAAVSDYGAISNAHEYDHMYELKAEAGLAAMKAGMDVEEPSKACYDDELEQWFKEGKADIKILDALVERVLTAKFEMGLFESPFALTGKELKDAFYAEEDKQISLKSARESLVLLKNDGILPISQEIRKIAIVGPQADKARRLFGGYTHYNMNESFLMHMNTMAGVDKDIKDGEMKTYPGTQVECDDEEKYDQLMKKLKPEIKSIAEEIQDHFPDAEVTFVQGYPKVGNDVSGFAEALEVCRQADLILLTLGGKNGSGSISTMGEGVDSTNINLPYCQEQFILEAAKLKKPMVAVHINGRPISSDAADAHCNAILECFVPSEMGSRAIAEVLTGEVNPSGRLPVSVAYNAGQVPVCYNHPNGSAAHQAMSIGFPTYMDLPHTPRYPFGFGLSYTTFAYENLKVDPNEKERRVTVSLDVVNTGAAAGTEVVQIYFEDLYASMVRPCRELAGFARVHLEAGERKSVVFDIPYSQFAFLDEDMQWIVEAGQMKIYASASSEDDRAEETFRIETSEIIDGKTRAFYTIGKSVRV